MMRFTFVLILCYSYFRFSGSSTTAKTCKVFVQPPWPTPYLLVPLNSTVSITCITKSGNLPFWTIDIGNDGQTLQLPFSNSREKLNDNGLFEVQRPSMPRNKLQLLINDTEKNNQTLISCSDNEHEPLQTTVLLYEPTPFELTGEEQDGKSINVSWRRKSLPRALTNFSSQYNLIISYGSQSQVIPLNVTHYQFFAPEGAPPCEVYNFSVTGTYIGATYTGGGCSVPSQIRSIMLPSRPNIAMLESSLSTSLEKGPSGGVTLRVSFKPANYCEMYPVTGYTLEVEGPTSHLANTWRQSSNSNLKLEITVKSLKANQAYIFRVVASNSVGNVSTESKIIYTTDVSSIQAVPQKESNTSMIACTFISGSDARGCRVVLVGKFGNVTANVTRSSKCSSHTTILNATHPLTSYNEVYGYDIESDGSIGPLAVPGVITRNSDKISPCVPGELKPSPSHNILPFWSIGIILGVVAVTIAMILALVIYCLCRRCKTEKDSTFYHVTRPSAGPAPLTQPPVPTQDFTDDDEKMKQQPIYDLPVKKQEHFYHVLETSTRRYQFKPDDFHKGGNSHDTQESPSHSESADSSPGDPLPLYHEVAETPLVRERQKPRVATVGKNDHSSSSSQDDSMPPLYHEITNLSARGATSRLPV